ncbi:MAG: hypothetical protein NC204_05400 [Candidatus Amulumruptor caecigallinarius]|nr:hypothetical protein [Candidatus Amulumruptor caecigallinarius]
MSNETVQYLAVFVILGIVAALTIHKIVGRKKRKSTGCCGCSMSEFCKDKKEEDRKC